MSAARIDIEAIVREVLQQLGQPSGESTAAVGSDGGPPDRPAGPPAGCPSIAPPKAGKSTASPKAAGAGDSATSGQGGAAAVTGGAGQGASPDRTELVVAGRVVTLDHLADRLDGVRRLVVPARAVITPAVHDELVARGIQVVRRSDRLPEPAASRLALWILGRRFDPAVLAAALEAEGIAAQWHRADCLIAATDAAAAAVTGEQTPAALITGEPAAAVCLANRHPGVRAVWAADPEQAKTHTAAVGANLLVLDPRRLAVFQMKQILVGFVREGLRACPEPLKSRLG